MSEAIPLLPEPDFLIDTFASSPTLARNDKLHMPGGLAWSLPDTPNINSRRPRSVQSRDDTPRGLHPWRNGWDWLPASDEDDSSPQDAAIGHERTTKRGHHFRVCEQIWDKWAQNWVAFVPRAPRNFGDALFIVCHRRHARHDGEVFTVLDVLERALVDILKEVCHDLVNSYESRLSLQATSLYPYIDALVARAEVLEAENDDAAAPLRSFIEVLLEEFKPYRQKMDRLLANGKVMFEFLWAVFKQGMYVRANYSSSREMIGVILESAKHIRSDHPSNAPKFDLCGRRLVWNGIKYAFKSWTHSITSFKGLKSIADIGVGILKDNEREELSERGKKYVEFTGVQHIELIRTTITYRNQVYGEKLTPERAMLDTDAYNKMHGSEYGYGHWEDDAQAASPPGFGWGDDVDGTNPYHQADGSQGSIFEPMGNVLAELLWTLPPTLPGYSFATKEWRTFHVEDIQKATYDEHAWDRLVLDADTKTLIRSLVHIHSTITPQSGTTLMSDWIKGKGGGLVVLLHGVAGVGKTLTAEAVAELMHLPLYVVGAGDLGDSPGNMEKELRVALDRAKSWGAVLLIDEADVFLERRATSDLMRNAMVATFLRLLEYHSGMLFLTTNRVRAFDEAFLSRVSVAIKYSELDIHQRSKIWYQFLTHVLGTETSEVLQDENFKELAMKPFNGRIIKNIVRTAQALALSSQEKLAMCHLRTVIVVTEKFLRDTEGMRDDATIDPLNEVVSLATN